MLPRGEKLRDERREAANARVLEHKQRRGAVLLVDQRVELARGLLAQRWRESGGIQLAPIIPAARKLLEQAVVVRDERCRLPVASLVAGCGTN